jgi:hypothetical protein
MPLRSRLSAGDEIREHRSENFDVDVVPLALEGAPLDLRNDSRQLVSARA